MVGFQNLVIIGSEWTHYNRCFPRAPTTLQGQWDIWLAKQAISGADHPIGASSWHHFHNHDITELANYQLEKQIGLQLTVEKLFMDCSGV